MAHQWEVARRLNDDDDDDDNDDNDDVSIKSFRVVMFTVCLSFAFPPIQ